MRCACDNVNRLVKAKLFNDLGEKLACYTAGHTDSREDVFVKTELFKKRIVPVTLVCVEKLRGGRYSIFDALFTCEEVSEKVGSEKKCVCSVEKLFSVFNKRCKLENSVELNKLNTC